jgi:hypothetical protein
VDDDVTRDVTRDETREGIEHLQAAAVEMIAAARSFLDAAEALIEDPAVARGVLAQLGNVVATVARAATSAAGGGGAAHGGADDDDPPSKVERIPVR